MEMVSKKEKILEYAKSFSEKFYIVPMKKNDEGKIKVPLIYKGESKNKENFNYKNFIQKIRNYKDDFGIGVFLGEQKLEDESGNKLYLYCIDFDADQDESGRKIDFDAYVKNTIEKVVKNRRNKGVSSSIEELCEGFEETSSGRAHFFFLSPVRLKKITNQKINGWFKIKNGKRVDGEIEFRGDNQFLSLHEGILCNFEKIPVLGRNIPVLSPEETKILLRGLGFEDVNTITKEEENFLKENKKLTKEKEKILKKEFNIKDKKRSIIEEIKRQVTIVEILEEQSSNFRIVYDHGNRLDCLCPFCEENNTSFSIYIQPDGSQIAVLYHDCGLDLSKLPYAKYTEEGYLVLDAIDIQILISGRDFGESLNELAKRKNIQIENNFAEKSDIPIFRSYDSKQFYLLDDERKKIYIGNKADARIWYLDYADNVGLSPKNFTKFLPSIEKVEIRFTPEYPFGKVPDKDIINGFHKSYYMEVYSKNEKTLSIDDISFSCFQEKLTQKYMKNLLDSEKNLKALASFMVLKLAGLKAEKMLIFKTNQGTGKSNIFVPILRELFKDEYVKVIPYDKFNKQFNPEFEDAYLIVIEEMYLRDKGSDSAKYENLKILTTSSKIQINKKGISEYDYDFPADFIGFSNKENPILISDVNERRIIILESPNSVDFYKIFSEKFNLTFDKAFNIIKSDFLDFVKNYLVKISPDEAKKFLTELVYEQNHTVKYELQKNSDKLLQLLDEFPYIDDYIVQRVHDDEQKRIYHVKSGIVTVQDIAVVLRLMGDRYYSGNARKIGSELKKRGITEIRGSKRYKILRRDTDFSLKECEEIYSSIEEGQYWRLKQFGINLNCPDCNISDNFANVRPDDFLDKKDSAVGDLVEGF